MVHYTKVFQGIAAFLDQEIMPRLSGISKWLFGGASALYLENMQASFEKLKDNPVLGMMGVIQGEEVDIEKAYRAIRKYAERETAEISIPGIGKIRLNEGDVDTIYRLIRGA